MEWQKSITEALLLSLPQCCMKDNRIVPFCTRNAGKKKKKSEGQLSVLEMLGGKKKIKRKKKGRFPSFLLFD